MVNVESELIFHDMRSCTYPAKAEEEELLAADEAELDASLLKLSPAAEEEKLLEEESWLEDEAELEAAELDWKEKLCPRAS